MTHALSRNCLKFINLQHSFLYEMQISDACLVGIFSNFLKRTVALS